jgi:hypothetical protein
MTVMSKVVRKEVRINHDFQTELIAPTLPHEHWASPTISFGDFLKSAIRGSQAWVSEGANFLKHFLYIKKQARVAFSSYTEEGDNFVLGRGHGA